MATSIRASDAEFLTVLPARAASCAGTLYLLSHWTHLNIRGCGIVGICAEVSVIVARFAVRCFTDNAKILRGTSPIARLVGGHYLANIALTALRFHPITFGASTVAILLPSLCLQILLKYSEQTPESTRLERDALL